MTDFLLICVTGAFFLFVYFVIKNTDSLFYVRHSSDVSGNGKIIRIAAAGPVLPSVQNAPFENTGLHLSLEKGEERSILRKLHRGKIDIAMLSRYGEEPGKFGCEFEFFKVSEEWKIGERHKDTVYIIWNQTRDSIARDHVLHVLKKQSLAFRPE